MPSTKRARQLGQLITKYRQAKGMKMTELAAHVDVGHAYISKLEAGLVKQPRPRHLVDIAKVLDLPVADLYSLAGYAVAEDLPHDIGVFLRTTSDLPDEAIRLMEEQYELIKYRFAEHGPAPGEDETAD